MSAHWEAKFEAWCKPPSESEEARCEHVEKAVRGAIEQNPTLNLRVSIIRAHGSWRNNTNVRQDSDVDVYVLTPTTFYYDLPGGVTADEIPITAATYHYPEYKNDIQWALERAFPPGSVHRGNKAFDIHANSYRVDADVIACFSQREYYRLTSGGFGFNDVGITFLSDAGVRIINYPEQNYLNGVTKNNATGRRYKSVVRILKRLRDEVPNPFGILGPATSILAPPPVRIPGFLIECLAYNAPNECFKGLGLLFFDVRSTLLWLYGKLQSDATASELVEVNHRKLLFQQWQPWTRVQALDFVVKALKHIGVA